MARPLRFSEPWQPVEITARTLQGRFLLRPSPRLRALIAGVLALARERYDVHIYNLVFLSNHFHLLCAASSPHVLSSFMCFVMGNLAREAGRLHDWEGTFWSRRHRSITVVDEASLIDRMGYIFANGCKEGLVSHPRLWPGLNAVQALTKGRPIEGVWVDRTAYYRARRWGRKDLSEKDFETRHTLTLDPLPCWADLPLEQQQAMNAELVAEAAAAVPEEVRQKAGRKAKLPHAPHHRPKKLEKSPAPLCHAASEESRSVFQEAYKAFEKVYRAASEQLRESLPALGYPTHAQVLAYAATEAGESG